MRESINFLVYKHYYENYPKGSNLKSTDLSEAMFLYSGTVPDPEYDIPEKWYSSGYADEWLYLRKNSYLKRSGI